MATPEALAAQAAHQELIEQLDMHAIQKTFRNPHWRPSQRRNKNVKTILGDASRREASAMATPQDKSGTNTPRGRGRPTGSNGHNDAGDCDDDEGLSTSGTTTPGAIGTTTTAATATATAAATAGGSKEGLQPNLAQANRSLSKLVLEKSLRAATAAATAPGTTGPSVTYTNVESAPSLAPQKRYCDITGLPASYTDPKTRLRYHNSEVFTAIRGLQQGVAEQYLELRGAHTVLK